MELGFVFMLTDFRIVSFPTILFLLVFFFNEKMNTLTNCGVPRLGFLRALNFLAALFFLRAFFSIYFIFYILLCCTTTCMRYIYLH